MNPEGPVALLTTFSTSGYDFAAEISFRNALRSGRPIAVSNRDTTSGNDLDEVMLNRRTLICLVAM
jgi:hypothetical protein